MTRQTFYRNLRKHAHLFKWEIDGISFIRGRADDHYFCPITAVHYAKTKKCIPTSHYFTAGNAIGLNDDDIVNIARAADFGVDKTFATTRKILLEATGIAIE